MNHLLILFFATFSAAFMATVPPGLLNMNAAKVSIEKGKTNAVIFSLGVSLMVVLQAYVAVLISKFLYRNPEVITWLQRLATLVFAFFAGYFFIIARKERQRPLNLDQVRKRNSFFRGSLLAALNLLTIPYYSALNAMWNASGWIMFEFLDILVFVLAAGCGTFSVLYLYIVYFNRLDARNRTFSKNSNYILSVLMLLLLVITIIRIIYT
jgi:threonine/homoserine/homoserine lactone efflux protein